MIGLTATGEGGEEEGQAKIATEHMGSIDFEPISELVKNILEGSENVFEL